LQLFVKPPGHATHTLLRSRRGQGRCTRDRRPSRFGQIILIVERMEAGGHGAKVLLIVEAIREDARRQPRSVVSAILRLFEEKRRRCGGRGRRCSLCVGRCGVVDGLKVEGGKFFAMVGTGSGSSLPWSCVSS